MITLFSESDIKAFSFSDYKMMSDFRRFEPEYTLSYMSDHNTHSIFINYSDYEDTPTMDDIDIVCNEIELKRSSISLKHGYHEYNLPAYMFDFTLCFDTILEEFANLNNMVSYVVELYWVVEDELSRDED